MLNVVLVIWGLFFFVLCIIVATHSPAVTLSQSVCIDRRRVCFCLSSLL